MWRVDRFDSCVFLRGKKLTTAIQNMDDSVLKRNSLDKILNFLTEKAEIGKQTMMERVSKFVEENPDVELTPNSPEEFLNDLSGLLKYRPVEKISLWRFRQARYISSFISS